MARTALAVQPVVIAGLAASYSAGNAEGHKVLASARHILHVKNGGGSSITVTVQTPVTVGGRAVAEDTVTIGAGADRFIGPFNPDVHGQPESVGADAGQAYVDLSSTTSVTLAALKV